MILEPWLRVFVCGKTQSGKSHLVKRVILPQLANILVYDIKREYGEHGVVCHTLEQIVRAFHDGVRRVIYQPTDLSMDHFDRLCAWVWDTLRNVTLVVDEVHNFCTSSVISPAFKRLITVAQGEPYRIGVVAISQRPANVHNDIKSNASLWFVFRLFLEADVRAVEMSSGIPGESVRSLGQHCFLVYDDRAPAGNEIVEFSPV